MKLAVVCLFSIVFCLATDLSSAWWGGRNSNGRHTANVNLNGANYNYRHGRHGVNAGHNWQNGNTNLGYTYNFGKRGLSADTQDDVLEFLKIEREPRVFLKKLQLAVNTLIKRYKHKIPELKILSIPVPDDQVTNVTVAKEILCVVKKLQKILPNNLGNFIVKMIKFHARDFGIDGLGDFFSVDPVQKTETEKNYSCEVPAAPASSELVDGARLVDMKKFAATLITAAMEYQQMLEA